MPDVVVIEEVITVFWTRELEYFVLIKESEENDPEDPSEKVEPEEHSQPLSEAQVDKTYYLFRCVQILLLRAEPSRKTMSIHRIQQPLNIFLIWRISKT